MYWLVGIFTLIILFLQFIGLSWNHILILGIFAGSLAFGSIIILDTCKDEIEDSQEN